MPIWQLCANLLIPNCLRSNLSCSPLAALELYVKIENAKIFLTYSGKLGIDLLVNPTIAFFRRLFPEKANFIRTDTGNVIELNLQEIDELQSVFEKMDLQSITFEENSFRIEADLKS